MDGMHHLDIFQITLFVGMVIDIRNRIGTLVIVKLMLNLVVNGVVSQMAMAIAGAGGNRPR